MKRFLMPALFLVFTSCFIFDSGDQIEFSDDLEVLYQDILRLAESQPCTDPKDWSFIALGSKPCGGPWEYIAYPKSINIPEFLAKVKRYNELQQEDNIKNNRYSDCMFVSPPKSVACENSKPVLLYE
ncbi:MAG: hypothetical protein HWE15_06445 [Algoriphagus sp.]|uniref:hypothetical protein n=1 Tax=Algoriphagus sp. TaxID=1872435 RepID=UPI0017A545CA|nr:hypothetical protein [Algoriphagus sp.]NVJ85925.1 hypothetical protein [Algoriphagus sp.]